MISFSTLLNYLRPLSPRRHQELERDIADEIRFHLEMRALDNVEEGMPSPQAQAAAEERFGDVEQIKDQCLAIQEQNPLRNVLQFGQALVALSLGIGAISTIFILINALFLQPLRFEEAQQLVYLREANATSGDGEVLISMPNYRDWKATTQSFEALTVFTANEHNLTDQDVPNPERVRSMMVAHDFFDVFGNAPLKGRLFTHEEESLEAGRFVLLSHVLWQERYDSDPTLIGRDIILDGYPATVLGIMPDEAQLSHKVDIWIPLWTHFPEWHRTQRQFYSIGRLKDGVTLSDVRAEMGQIGARLAATHPQTNTNWGITVLPLQELYTNPVQHELYALLIAAALLLLIVLAGLFKQMMARAIAIEREQARATSRLRRLGETLAESVLLALLGGVLGLLLAQRGAFVIDSYVIGTSADLFQISLDWHVWAFALTLSLGVGLFMGLAPSTLAERAVRRQSTSAMRRREVVPHDVLSRMLGVATVALALVLLIPFGMMLRSYVELQHQEKGFEAEQVVRVFVPLTRRSYDTFTKYQTFYQQALETLTTLPDVQSVSLAHSFPGTQPRTFVNFAIADSTISEPDIWDAQYTPIAPNYFQTMGISVEAGRAFTDADTVGNPRVAIINTSLAKALWPNQNPIGQSIDISLNGYPRRVIGIVNDVSFMGPRSQTSAIIYTPVLQSPPELMSLVVRSQSQHHTKALAASIRAAISTIDPHIPIASIGSGQVIWDDHLRTALFYVLMFGLGAGIALLLATLFIYRIIADAVQAQSRVFGLRLAFGAKSWQVLALALRPGFFVLGVGIAIGLLASFLFIPALNDVLIGIRPEDPVTYIGVAATVAVIALLAGYIPARRAIHVDPLLALRYG